MTHNWKPIEYKFILLGDSLVGKTSIFLRLSGKSFSTNTIPTLGTEKIVVNFDDVQIDEKVYQNFKVSLFDTAGQERFRSISRAFFRDSQGIVLLYSVIDKESYKHIQSWLDSIKDSLSDWKRSGYMVMILGNKLDCIQENIKREIPIEEVQKMCSDQGIYWGGECSAKTFDIKQLKEIFEKFIKHIYLKLGNDYNDKNKKKGSQKLSKDKSKSGKNKKSCCS